MNNVLGERKPNFTMAAGLTEEAKQEIAAAFQYHPWDSVQVEAGQWVRDVLAAAVEVIVDRVPPCPDRSAAIRKIREARMDCNSAITHHGKY